MEWVMIFLEVARIVDQPSLDFVISKITPDLVTALGYQLFLVYASINVVVMTTFAMYVVTVPWSY